MPVGGNCCARFSGSCSKLIYQLSSVMKVSVKFSLSCDLFANGCSHWARVGQGLSTPLFEAITLHTYFQMYSVTKLKLSQIVVVSYLLILYTSKNFDPGFQIDSQLSTL